MGSTTVFTNSDMQNRKMSVVEFYALIVTILLMLSLSAHAQIGIPVPPPLDTTKQRIKIENADSAEYLRAGEEARKILVGNVVLNQKNTMMYADSMVVVEQKVRAFGNVIIEQDTVRVYANRLIYNGDTRKARLLDDVVLSDGKQQLFTDKLDYNLDTEIGEYHTGATLEGEGINLKSQHGYYHKATKQAYFKGNVEVLSQI